MDDIKGLTAGVSSRKRGKRRYFWEYSEQLTPSKQERLLKPSEWDRHTLPSNLYQKNGPLHGMHANLKETPYVKLSRDAFLRKPKNGPVYFFFFLIIVRYTISL